MLDYNTLNNLVEIFKKQGVRGVTLENGSTLEIKEGTLLVNGKSVEGAKVIDTDNITTLSTETIEGLSAGDIVVKHTGEQTHTYIVTYKEEHHGICISYFDAGYTETVSYDYVTDAWVYNSTDVVTPKEYTAGDGISINEEGVISNTRPLYKYTLKMDSQSYFGIIEFYSSADVTLVNTLKYSELFELLYGHGKIIQGLINGTIYSSSNHIENMQYYEINTGDSPTFKYYFMDFDLDNHTQTMTSSTNLANYSISVSQWKKIKIA